MPSLRNPQSVVFPRVGPKLEGSGSASFATANVLAHITDPVGAHAATAISYAGGAAWLDGATNPATSVELQLDKLVDDLINQSASNSGAHKTGIGARTNWLGGRTNPSATLFASVDKIITDLAVTTSSDDGAERVGAASKVSTGSFGTVGAGSVRSQLDVLIDQAASLINANTFQGTAVFQNTATFEDEASFEALVEMAAGLSLHTQDPFLITAASGVDLRVDLTNANMDVTLTGATATSFRITNGTSTIFEFKKGGIGGDVNAIIGSQGTGLADSYLATPNQIFSPASSSLQSRGLAIQPAGSGGVGPPLILRPGGEDSAGSMPGMISLAFDVNEGNGGQRRYIPTQTYALEDGGPAQLLATVAGSSSGIQTRGTSNNSVVIIEAYVFCLGWNGGSPINNVYGAWKRRAVGNRNNSGTYTIQGPVQDVKSETNLTDSLPVITIVADASGFHISVTPATMLGPTDQLYWGYLVLSAFNFNNNPDNDFT